MSVKLLSVLVLGLLCSVQGIAAKSQTFRVHLLSCSQVDNRPGASSYLIDNYVTVKEDDKKKRTITSSYCIAKAAHDGTVKPEDKCPKATGLELVAYRSDFGKDEVTQIFYHDGSKTKASGLVYLNEELKSGGQFLVIDLNGTKAAGESIHSHRATSPDYRCNRLREVAPNFETIELE